MTFERPPTSSSFLEEKAAVAAAATLAAFAAVVVVVGPAEGRHLQVSLAAPSCCFASPRAGLC